MLNNILNFTKKHIKKAVFLVYFFCVIGVYASSTTWDFISSGDYTYSTSTGFTVSGSIASLNKNTLAHIGVITNATNYNGAYDVVVDGIYAYMTSFLGDRVNVLNISNPSLPTLVGSIINNAGTIRLDGASGIVKEGNYLYVASNVSDALQIIDVTNPAAPVQVGQLVDATNLNGARGIAKSGNYVYITADTRDAFIVVNVTNPAAPTRVGTLRDATNLNGARDIKIVGNYAYVTAYDGDRFTVVNITTPTTPTVAISITDATNLNGAWKLEILGNYAYVSAYLNASVRIIDITSPTTPTAVTNISGGNYSLTNPMDIIADGNYLYISSFGLDAVNIADITNPTAPVFVSKILHNVANPLLDGVYGLFKVGDFIYTAVYNSDALEILKLTYPTTSPFLQPVTAFNYGILNNVLSFNETLGVGNEGTITYQISKDNGTTWYYLNGSTWTTTTGGVANSSSATSINSNLSTFNALGGGTGIFTFKAFFTSNGTQKVELDAVNVTASDPASPGGVSTNMSIWLKANKGTSTTTDGVSLTSWADQSGNGYDAGGGVSPTYLNNTSTGNINFNPYINFNGSTQYLENLNNGGNSKSYFMVVVPNNQVDGTVAGQVPFAWDCNSGILSSGTCGLSFAGGVLGAFTIAMNDEVITHALGSSVNRRSAQIGAYSYEASRPMLIGFNENSSANGTDLYEKGVKIDNFTANTYQTLATADYRIGMTLDGANPFPYNGKIAEIINYSSRISDTDRQKIESYLAFKYGITLNGGTQNYIASDGSTVIWSTGSAGAFINDIFGVGRDDGSALGQVKSRSMKTDGIITLTALGEGTNMSPSYVDIANKEFFTISNDAGGNTWTSIGAPTGYDILARKWKVQEIGDIGTISLDFDVANSGFDVPLLSTGSNYYFVYDSNSNGSFSDETPVVMTNTSGNIWQISGVNLSNGQIFTLISLTSSNNIPTNITLSNNTINENVALGSAIGTLITTDADVGDLHTYSFITGIGDTDNGSFTLSGNILKINESPDYEIKSTYTIRIQTDDGHGGLYQKQFYIYINNLGETINSILDFEIPGKYTVTSGNWSRLTTNPYEKLYSIVSNNGGLPNTQSCFEVINTFSATGTVAFHYNVSSDTTDYLRFYIDNIEQQAWSGIVPWALYSKNDVLLGTHSYKWCYIKDGATSAGTDNAFIDYITYADTAIDSIPPTITSINYASGYLLPGGNHNLIINYNDLQSGINTSSDIIALYKWDGVSWGSDISSTGLNLAGKTITTTSATYSTNNLVFGKYMYNFQISDNYSNSSSTGVVFYIDEPEIIVSTGSFDIGILTGSGLNFSTNEIIVTVKTVGASFQIEVSKDTSLTTGAGSIIIDWDGSKGVGYDKNPYTLVNKNINANPVIGTGTTNININGVKNVYTFPIKIGTLIDLEQAAGTYQMNLSFRGIFGY